MMKFFGKSSKLESNANEAKVDEVEENDNDDSESETPVPSTSKTKNGRDKSRVQKAVKESKDSQQSQVDQQGEKRRRHKSKAAKGTAEASPSKHGSNGRGNYNDESANNSPETNDELENSSKIQRFSDSDKEAQVPARRKEKSRRKSKTVVNDEPVSSPPQPKPRPKRRQRDDVLETVPSSSEEPIEYVNKKDLKSLPKVEPGKNGQFLASMSNYNKPISNFNIRAKLLKYPTFTDKELWSGDFAVIDDRVFGWQEKVFSKTEVKWYQKLENCKTEQEKKYHEMLENADSFGRYLYTYVSDDPYVVRKKLRTLTKRCPVPHIRKDKKKNKLYSDAQSPNSDGESFDEVLDDEDLISDEIDFIKPISSSTPKTSRKLIKETEDIAKVEKKEREQKEKESKDLDKQNKKLQEIKAKKEKADEKRRKQEDVKASEKLKKIEAMEAKDQEHRDEYLKKYNYSKRPSLPLGARMRSIQLSPSPRKFNKKYKSLISSDLSLDHLEEKESEVGSKKGQKVKKHDEENGESPKLMSRKSSDQKPRHYRKVDHEYGGKWPVDRESDLYKRSKGYNGILRTQKDSKRCWKYRDLLSNEDNQTMYIMASIPYLPHKFREIVVCMIKNVPQQGVLLFKPSLGYRNVEVKRNHVYRISCELYPDKPMDSSDGREYVPRKTSDIPTPPLKPDGMDDFVGFFEMVPNNELRLTVMGEITAAEGFDSSPVCIYYAVDIPKGWRNDSVLSDLEGMTHVCFSNHDNVTHFSHHFSFQLSFSMDSIEESDTFPSPTISLMVVSINHPSPRILYEGYGYISIPMTPGSHFVKVRTWKPQPRTILDKMKAVFLDITPSLQDMKFVHMPCSADEDNQRVNLVGLHTEPSGTVKMRLHVIHQTSAVYKEHEKKLDLLEKMSSATVLKSVQVVIQAFQNARRKAMSIKNQYE